MKKVLSLLLVLTLILTGFSTVFAAVPPDVAGQPSEEAVSVLMDLGVVNGYADGTYKPGQAVTRAEMAKLIIVALGLKNNASATTSPFPDMAGAAWAQGFVSYASSLGIIKGYPDGTFKPSQTVSYNEAAAMIIRALGYTDASLAGTWPANYVVKANSLGIFTGIISSSGGASRGDIAIMLFHSLRLDIGTVGANNVWTANGADTMLSRLGITFVPAAVLTGNENAAFDIKAYMGAYAETYLDRTGQIVSLSLKSTFLTGEYNGSVFTASGVNYTVSSALAAGSRPVFINGSGSGSSTLNANTAVPLKLAVAVTGRTITAVYSISTWTASADGLFTAADASSISTAQTLFGFDFVLNTNGTIDTSAFTLQGAANLKAIKTDNVVYVYADAAGLIRKISVGTEIVTGKVTRISNLGVYTVAGRTLTKTTENVTPVIAGVVGDSVKVYLDVNGAIYVIKVTSGSSISYGIALDVGNGIGSGISGQKPAIQIFLSTGAAKVYSVDETRAALKTDFFTTPATPRVWVHAPAPGTIVQYSVNSSGLIDTLKDNLVQTATANITSRGNFNGHAISSNAVIFAYAGTNYALPENYSTRSRSSVLGMTSVQAKYIVDPATNQIVAMLLETGVTNQNIYGVATSWATNNTAAGYEITFLSGGTAVTYNAALTAYDTARLNNTLLYRLNFNLAGNVTSLTPMNSLISVTGATTTGFVVTSGATSYTLDTAVVVYRWNASLNAYETGVKSDIVNATLFDVFGNADQIYDIVLIPPVI